jgi:hypothetical protein
MGFLNHVTGLCEYCFRCSSRLSEHSTNLQQHKTISNCQYPWDMRVNELLLEYIYLLWSRISLINDPHNRQGLPYLELETAPRNG